MKGNKLQYISPNIVINLDQKAPCSAINGTGKPVNKSEKVNFNQSSTCNLNFNTSQPTIVKPMPISAGNKCSSVKKPIDNIIAKNNEKQIITQRKTYVCVPEQPLEQKNHKQNQPKATVVLNGAGDIKKICQQECKSISKNSIAHLQKITSSNQKKLMNNPQKRSILASTFIISKNSSRRQDCKPYYKPLNSSNASEPKIVCIDLTSDEDDQVIPSDVIQLQCRDEVEVAIDKPTIPDSHVTTSVENEKIVQNNDCGIITPNKIITAVPLDNTLMENIVTNLTDVELLTEEEKIQEEFYKSLNNTTEYLQNNEESCENILLNKQEPQSEHETFVKNFKSAAKETPKYPVLENIKQNDFLTTSDKNIIDFRVSGLDIDLLLDSIDADEIVEALKNCTSEKEFTLKHSFLSNSATENEVTGNIPKDTNTVESPMKSVDSNDNFLQTTTTFCGSRSEKFASKVKTTKKYKKDIPTPTKQESRENTLVPKSKQLVCTQIKLKEKNISHKAFKPKHENKPSIHKNKKKIINNNSEITRQVGPKSNIKNTNGIVQDANIRYKYGAIVNSKCLLKNYVIPKIRKCESVNKGETVVSSQKKYSFKLETTSENTKEMESNVQGAIIEEKKGLVTIENNSEEPKGTNMIKPNVTHTSKRQADKNDICKDPSTELTNTNVTDKDTIINILLGIQDSKESICDIQNHSVSHSEEYDEISLIENLVHNIISNDTSKKESPDEVQIKISGENKTSPFENNQESSLGLNTVKEINILPEAYGELPHMQDPVGIILLDINNLNDMNSKKQKCHLENACKLSVIRSESDNALLNTVKNQEKYSKIPHVIITDGAALKDRNKHSLTKYNFDVIDGGKLLIYKDNEHENKLKSNENTKEELKLNNRKIHGKRKAIENYKHNIETKKNRIDLGKSECQKDKGIKNICRDEKNHSTDIDKKKIVTKWASSNKILAGRYSINGKLHRGNNSWLIKTTDKENKNALTAVKMLPKKTVSDKPEQVKILLKLSEADRIGQFNCMRALDIFQHNNYWCIAMNYYPVNLSQALKRNGAGFHIDKVRELSRQLLNTLLLLRINEIIHTDIQPHHILLNQEVNKLRLTGFDNAVDSKRANTAKHIITQNYQAPEILLGKCVSYAADIWSAACTMFEIASQRVLFQGENAKQIMDEVVRLKGPIPGQHLKKDSQLKNKVHMVNIQSKLYDAYKLSTVDSTYSEKSKKIQSFSDLLDGLLTLDCAKRKQVELAYVHPFIYEYAHKS